MTEEYTGEQINLLGDGSIAIADVAADGWAGICFLTPDEPLEMGVLLKHPEGTTDVSMNAFLRVTAVKEESLRVIIRACERAILRLQDLQNVE